MISAPQSWLGGGGSTATTVLPSGITLVIVSSGFPAASYALAYAFTSTCAPDPAFGNDGVERLTFGGQTVSVEGVVPSPQGGAILVGGIDPLGQQNGGWLVARIDVTGALDPTFGTGGWSVLPWTGSASAVTQTPSGKIVVGGSGGGGCCVQAWVGELTANGAIVNQFGSQGRSQIPVYRDDSGISEVAVETGGNILALTTGGNMGYWGVNVSALTSTGAPVPSFQANFTAAMEHVAPSGIFVGDLVVRSNDLLLLGTEQDTDVATVPDPTAQGRVVAFQSNGELEQSFGTSGEVHFASPMAQLVWALPRDNGHIVVAELQPLIQSIPHAQAYLSLFGFSADGTIDQAFGQDGTAEIQLPYLSQDMPASSLPITFASNGQVSDIVTSAANGQALSLTQIFG